MKFAVDEMLEYYSGEAEKHGLSGTSTIQDVRTRELEYEAIKKYLQDDTTVLEVGCGNGYTAWRLLHEKNIKIDAYDLCPELIELAGQRVQDKLKGQVNYFVGDATKYKKENAYDTVFTERALQNIPTWEGQKIALRNIAESLKSGGIFIMEECFLSGLRNMNAARAELDLSPVDQPWHNLFFDDDSVFTFMEECGMSVQKEDCFLSGYYFGSRVLLPVIYPKDKPVKSTSVLNDYFCQLPPAGNFCPMRIVIFKKG